MAYKSLLKEKEALEASLASLTSKKTEPDAASSENKSTAVPTTETPSASGVSGSKGDEVDQLRMQISTLMNSLATLSAEKSKMEASFQADRKSVRSELKLKDQTIAELEAKFPLNSCPNQTRGGKSEE